MKEGDVIMGSQYTVYISGLPFNGEHDFITEARLVSWAEHVTDTEVTSATRVMRKPEHCQGGESGDIGCAKIQFAHPQGARNMFAAYHRKLLVRRNMTSICCVESSSRNVTQDLAM